MFIFYLHRVSSFNPTKITALFNLFHAVDILFTFCERHTLTEATNLSQTPHHRNVKNPIIHEFRLLPRNILEQRSSGLLRSE
jgi:hypothetical protein